MSTKTKKRPGPAPMAQKRKKLKVTVTLSPRLYKEAADSGNVSGFIEEIYNDWSARRG